MKINGSFFGFNYSAKGMSIQRKKMDLISQNIANANSVRNANGEPYQRKFLKVEQDSNLFANKLTLEGQQLKLNTSDQNHINFMQTPEEVSINGEINSTKMNEVQDTAPGEMVYMPDNPEANEQGYVQMSNVNVINEMVDMIAATRSYEANLQTLNSAKQMAKDSLEIQMKITSNIVGNYGPSYLKPAQTVRKESAVQTSASSISSEEKKFFASLYPAQKDEVLNYQFYNSKGKVTGTHVGSLFDRRG